MTTQTPIKTESPDDRMVCDQCGHTVSRRTFEASEEYGRCTLPEVGGSNETAAPAEYVDVCPECGAEDSFSEAARCGDCGEYDCICNVCPECGFDPCRCDEVDVVADALEKQGVKITEGSK